VLTDNFYAALMARLVDAACAGGGFYIAVGGGDAGWDRNPPLLERRRARLANELARKAVAARDVRFLDASGADTQTASARLRLRARFEPGEANGTLRELGLFSLTGIERDSGTLLSYFVHGPIEKTATMVLERVLHLDLTPRAVGGVQPTRFLGNSKSREVHDLENQRLACQLDEILFDRRIFFGSVGQAVALGYDFCAFCFGRGQSRR